MFHRNRKWSVADMTEDLKARWDYAGLSDDEALAKMLVHQTWCLCTGFRLGGYLYLNDSTSEDGAAEYAIVKEATGIQVESITFCWTTDAQAVRYIQKISAGKYDGENYGCALSNSARIEPSGHHACHLCA